MKNINWNGILFKSLKSPIEINVTDPEDTSNFDRYLDEDYSKIDELPSSTVDPFGFF